MEEFDESEWTFAQDDEWYPITTSVMHSLMEGAAGMSAGTATLVGRSHSGSIMGIHAVARIGGYEIAVKVEVDTGEVLWAYRDAPERCEGCGKRLKEETTVLDNEGVALCPTCAADLESAPC